MSSGTKDYGYIAYIDEAGDPGLKRVRPIDQNGASEWLVLSAVVMQAKREPDVLGWTQGNISNLGVKQRHDLHYRTLSPTRKSLLANRSPPYQFGLSPYARTRRICGVIITPERQRLRWCRFSGQDAKLIPT
jgi:hypothetical protein